MSAPTVYDAKGRALEVGSRVQVFPDTARPDESRVTGFKKDWLGWRVEHSWLTGHHPDDPDPSEYTEATCGHNTYRCPDLLLITDDEKGDGDGTSS